MFFFKLCTLKIRTYFLCPYPLMHRVQFLLIFHHTSHALLGVAEVKAYRTEGGCTQTGFMY